jgi:DNA polymerase III gamma/tau subunit
VADFHKTYRPKRLEDVVGQPEAVKILKEKLEKNKVPHVIMFAGPSGCGKTTLARILARRLGCKDSASLTEINAASSRGIDTVRDIERSTQTKPLNGICRVFILDEVHMLTRKQGGDAQTALLKTLEDSGEENYFFLCTTDPMQLRDTIRSRCFKITLKPVPFNDLVQLVNSIATKEGKKLPESVAEKIAEAAEGGAREAKQLLEKVIEFPTEEEMLNSIETRHAKKYAIDLCRKLMDFRSTWDDVKKILNECEEPAENVRLAVLGYARAVILKGGLGKAQSKAFSIICEFEKPFFRLESAGLLRACMEVLNAK